MMSLIYSCIGEKPPEERSELELRKLIPWFKKYGKGVLKSLSDAIIIDILQHCSLQFFKEDELIIMQGERGDSFFIVVYGEISVYVNDNNAPLLEKPNKNQPIIIDKDFRGIFGQCVASEDAGYSFGEYALFDENCTRKASIIATAETTLIEINRKTYEQSLKNIQEALINERESFIQKHPLFCDWNFRMKNMLMMSLKKITIPFESNIVCQGEEWKGLIFITKGSGRLIIDPTKHDLQFPDLFPLDFDTYDKRYQEFPELKPKIVKMDLSEAESVAELMPKYIRRKRARINAAQENHGRNYKSLVCTVQPGEIVGDLEFLFDLHHNLYTIISTEESEAFFLDLANIERVLKRMNSALVCEKLKAIIKSKMNHREKYFRDAPIPLMWFLKCKLYDKRIVNRKLLPKLITEKQLPSDDLEWQHVLKMYQEDKAALCKPLVKGGIFLKDLMNKKAHIRHHLKLSDPKKTGENEIKASTSGLNNNFPITQERIYELQKIAPDPLKMLELLFNDMYGKLSKSNTARKDMSPDVELKKEYSAAEGDEEVDKSKTNKLIQLVKSPAVTKNQFKDGYLKYKQNAATDFLNSNDATTMLQNSQIKFLNSLCSEKSRYEISMNSDTNSHSKNQRIHILPSLKIQHKTPQINSPVKGARILVKKRKCLALDTPHTLLNHVHDHFQFVDNLQWEKVDKMQMGVSNFMNTEYNKHSLS